MFQQIINWRVLVAIIAILIVSGTIVYSRYLANKIAIEEKQKVEEWVEAGKFLVESPNEADTRLPFRIIQNDENGFIVKFPHWYLSNEPKPGERITFSAWNNFKKTDPLLESGLLGPVRLVIGVERMINDQ